MKVYELVWGELVEILKEICANAAGIWKKWLDDH